MQPQSSKRTNTKATFLIKSVFVLPLLMLLMHETVMLLSVCNRIAQLDKFLQKDSNAKNASLSSRQFMCKAFLHSSTYPLLFYHYIPPTPILFLMPQISHKQVYFYSLGKETCPHCQFTKKDPPLQLKVFQSSHQSSHSLL